MPTSKDSSKAAKKSTNVRAKVAKGAFIFPMRPRPVGKSASTRSTAGATVSGGKAKAASNGKPRKVANSPKKKTKKEQGLARVRGKVKSTRLRTQTRFLIIDGSNSSTYDAHPSKTKNIVRSPSKPRKTQPPPKRRKRLVTNLGSNAYSSDDDQQDKAHLKPLEENIGVDWSNVGGLKEHVSKVRESVILPLLQPEIFESTGLSRAKGLLFYGAPGTGKTLMARGLVGECRKFGLNITFYARKSADLLSKYIGEGEKHLRELFETAKKTEPSVIFFDEIDGLAPIRNVSTDHSHSSIVSTLLALMDGLEDRGKVIVIGATNRVDSLDPALRRPGRFDLELEFQIPDRAQRQNIFGIHSKTMTPEFHYWLSTRTPGFTGADIRALCNEASLNAVRRTFPILYEPIALETKMRLPPGKVNAVEQDYENALSKISSSAERHTINPAKELRREVLPLFQDNLEQIRQTLASLCPQILHPSDKLTSWKHPHAIISGDGDFVTKFVGPAMLHALEHLPVHSLDLVNVVSNGMNPLQYVATTFREANHHAPSIVYLPNVDRWHQFADESLRLTLLQCIKGLSSSKPVCVICTLDCKIGEAMSDDLEEMLENFEKIDLEVCDLEARKEFLRRLFSTRMVEDVERQLRHIHQATIQKEQEAENEQFTLQMKIPELTPETETTMFNSMQKILSHLKASKRFVILKKHLEAINTFSSWDDFEAAIQNITCHQIKDRPTATLLWEEAARKIALERKHQDDKELARLLRTIDADPDWLGKIVIGHAATLVDPEEAPRNFAASRRIRPFWPKLDDTAKQLSLILQSPEKNSGSSWKVIEALELVQKRFGKDRKITHTKYSCIVRTGQEDAGIVQSILRLNDKLPKLIKDAAESIKQKINTKIGNVTMSASSSSAKPSTKETQVRVPVALTSETKQVIRNAVDALAATVHKANNDGDALRPTFQAATLLETALLSPEAKSALEELEVMMADFAATNQANSYNTLVNKWNKWSAVASRRGRLSGIVEQIVETVLTMSERADVDVDTDRYLILNETKTSSSSIAV